MPTFKKPRPRWKPTPVDDQVRAIHDNMTVERYLYDNLYSKGDDGLWRHPGFPEEAVDTKVILEGSWGPIYPRLAERLNAAPIPLPESDTTTIPAGAAGGDGVAEIIPVIESADVPHRLARLFLSQRYRIGDDVTLRYWNAEWYRWRATAYRQFPERDLRAELGTMIKAEFDRLNLEHQQECKAKGEKPKPAHQVTNSLLNNSIAALASMALIDAATVAPSWLADSRWTACEVLAAANGLVHLPSLVDGTEHFRPPSPLFFSTSTLDYDFDRAPAEPTAWLLFLTKLWPDDPASVQALQEWFGYLLSLDTRQQKGLMLIGPLRSGKGTILRVARAVIGEANTCGPTLSSLATNFGLAPMLGKSLATISDARLCGRTDNAVIIERLLSIIGEDALSVDRKFLPAITAKMTARIMLCTNELPRVTDASGAFASRFLLLRLTESWLNREDPLLTDRLLRERSGILDWAVDGWKRLRERGYFLQPDSGRELYEELRDLASPVAVFVWEECELSPMAEVSAEELYTRWCRWCARDGRKEPGTSAWFGRDLHAAFPAIKRVNKRNGSQRHRGYQGIKLLEEEVPAFWSDPLLRPILRRLAPEENEEKCQK